MHQSDGQVEKGDRRLFAVGPASETPDADDAESFIVVVGDPQTGELDCYGPHLDRLAAGHEARRLRREFDVADLPDVIVTVARCSMPERVGPAHVRSRSPLPVQPASSDDDTPRHPATARWTGAGG